MAQKTRTVKICGHENKHYEAATGKSLTCELNEGHEGDHYSNKVENGFWSDGAGKPPGE